MRRLFNTIRREYGASMVEFIVAIPFVLTGMLAVIDLSRYVATRALLTRSAQVALEVAVREKDFDAHLTSYASPYWPAYQAALNKIRTVGMNVATKAAARSTSPSNNHYAKLLPTTISASGWMTVPTTSDIVVLRPGDVGTINGETVNYAPIPTGQSFVGALRTTPITVELRARVKLLTPFMGQVAVAGRAFGFREVQGGQIQELAEAESIGCGNGIVEPGLGEECDQAENCSSDCLNLICGDGIERHPETCDPSVFATNPAPWFRRCYPPGHVNACRPIAADKSACGPGYDVNDPNPTSACCGDVVQQETESCETTWTGPCNGEACASCEPNYCAVVCTGGSCPAGQTMQYIAGSGCVCRQNGSVNN